MYKQRAPGTKYRVRAGAEGAHPHAAVNTDNSVRQSDSLLRITDNPSFPSSTIPTALELTIKNQGEKTMDKDRIKGKMKDVAGRVQRQAGEWTGNEEQQVKGAAKQAEGKVQNIAGRIKDAGRDAMRDAEKNQHDDELETEDTRKKRPA
jgi:uncharacterized protein YjbJ (UPF0337 family)